MAQYWEDWSGSSLGGDPTGWTKRFSHTSTTYEVRTDAEGPAGLALRITKGTAQRSLLSLDAVDADADRAKVKIRALVRIVTDESSSASVSFAGVAARGAGSTSSETLISGALGKGSGFALGTYSEARSLSYASGTLTATSSSAGAYTQTDLYWIGLDLDGTSVTVTTAAEATPGTIIRTATYTTGVTAAGWTGLFSFSGSTVTSFDVFCVAIATGESDAFYAEPGSGTDPVAFEGTVGAQSWPEDSAITPLDLSTYFSGDFTPFAYAVTTGTLPAGLSLGASTGVISGTPTTAASAVSIVVTATDDAENEAPTNSFDITITAVDSTAPTLSSPTGTETGATTASGSVSTNEGNGTLYAVVTTSGTPPSAADIRAGTGVVYYTSQAVSATGVQNVSATGLTAETTYYWHFLHDDAASNASNIVSSVSFTTDAAYVPTQMLRVDELLYVDKAKTSLYAGTVGVVVLDREATRAIAYQNAAVTITDGALDIEHAAFETVDDAFDVVIIASGTVRGVFPATVIEE